MPGINDLPTFSEAVAGGDLLVARNVSKSSNHDEKLSISTLGEGLAYRLSSNPTVTVMCPSDAGSAIFGSPRMAFVSLIMDYDGTNNATESALINIYGTDVSARDCRRMNLLSGSAGYAATGQYRNTVYGAQGIDSNGSYLTMTPLSSYFGNTGYTYTLEILGNSNGTIRVRTTRTGGVTTAAKIHVHLILTW